MKNFINFIIKEDDNNKRVDTILANHDKSLSRTRVKNLILDSKLKINEKIIKDPSVKTELNDKIDNKLKEDMNYLQKEFFIEDLLKVLSQKKKIDINEEVVNLELKRKYQIDLSKMKDEHKERIDSLKKLTSENIQKDVLFSELVKFLNVKVEQKELQEYIQKYYGEKIDQRTAEAAYGTLLRNKIADESMKTFKIKETKLSLEELMKKGSQNHESSTHSH